MVALAACCAVHAGIVAGAAAMFWGVAVAPVALLLVLVVFLRSRRMVRADAD